jgi:uncharacterized protein YifE (UPF0438 family)
MKNLDWRDCVSSIERGSFSEKEKVLLDRHFAFYWDVYNEFRKPTTVLQKQFVKNCFEGCPQTRHESAFYKFLEKSGNVEEEPDDQHQPISDEDFIRNLRTIVRDDELVPFYHTNLWTQYVESRNDFSLEEAYVLDYESGYLSAVYDEVIAAPSEDVERLILNCHNGTPESLRERAFLKFIEAASFSEVEGSSTITAKDAVPGVKDDKPTPRELGPATIDQILGGKNGQPQQYLETDVVMDTFGNRKSWKRMRGANRPNYSRKS